jgi:hypothetical protein
MDNETYEAVKACVCSYCDAGLPSTLWSYPHKNLWTHTIPGSGERFDCAATRLRNARFDPKENQNA